MRWSQSIIIWVLCGECEPEYPEGYEWRLAKALSLKGLWYLRVSDTITIADENFFW